MTLQITDWNKQALSGKKISEKESKNFVDWIYNELQPNEGSVNITMCDNFSEFLQNVGLKKPENCINGKIRDYVQNYGISQIREKINRHDWIEMKRKSDGEFSKVLKIAADVDWSARRMNPRLNPTDAFIQDFKGLERKIGLGYDAWSRVYDHYLQEGVFQDERFQRFREFVLQGVWEAVFFKDEAVICRLPKQVVLSTQGLLNSIGKEPAIVWHDGTKSFYKHGICVDGINLKKRRLQDLLQTRDIEQRTALLKDCDFDELMRTAIPPPELINKSKRGTKLYEMQLEPGHMARFLVYNDPSTGREYVSYVPPETQTADEGMAWKFQLEEKEYENLDGEA